MQTACDLIVAAFAGSLFFADKENVHSLVQINRCGPMRTRAPFAFILVIGASALGADALEQQAQAVAA
jgi:hypothetical protein